MARGRNSGKKSGSKPTSKKRSDTQSTKDRYAHAREDAQLAGLIPTTPEEALKSERVDPALQGNVALPELVRQALRESWATPDSAKPAILSALLEPFFKEDEVLNEHGEIVKVKPSRRLLMELAKTLRMLDQTQWERDHPVEAGKAKGGSSATGGTTTINGVTINNTQLNIEAAALIRGMIEDGQLGTIEGIIETMQPPDQSSPPSNS